MADRLTASNLARAAQCTASCVLPAVYEDASRAASDGTNVHAFLHRVLIGEDVDLVLSQTPESVRSLCASIDPRHYKIQGAECEVAFAFDTVSGTARKTGDKTRNYSSWPTEICGTADVVVWSPDALRGPTILDWKTVRGDFDPETYRPQLEFYALCAARVSGASYARWAIGVIDPNGNVGYHTKELDFEDLAEIARECCKTFRRVQSTRNLYARGAIPDTKEGKHCTYCKAWRYCPSKQVLLSGEIGKEPISKEAAMWAFHAAKARERWAEETLKTVKEFVRENGPIANDEGQILTIDGRDALRLKPKKEKKENV